MKREPLPIDDSLPRIVRHITERRRLLLVAEPGAGKTTRVPAALLEAKDLGEGLVLVAQPRRIAARMAARRVAAELGEEVGERVGYAVRFERRAGKRTRLLFVTVGVLLRRLMSEPDLPGVAAVVLDEIHERTAELDLCLALLRELSTARRDLALVGMSATLEARSLADYLACEVIEVGGRAHPIELEHLERPDTRHLDLVVASAARRLLRRIPQGDLLIFLPGAGEIRRSLERLGELPEADTLDILPLHGSLPVDQQERAVRPSKRRKLIVATNVAETSLTIPGVVAVIDSGLARVAGTSPQTGMPSLLLTKVSQASARQRAGRAGRLGPGYALRLYTRHDHDSRPLHDEPEMLRVDLAETLLRLHLLGHDPRRFELPAAPPARALESAEELLRRLGALREGHITKLGRRLSELPAHPRVARVMLEAQDRGAGSRGALLAALMGEREIRRELRGHVGGGKRRAHGDPLGASDLLARLERFEAAELDGLSNRSLRSHDLEPMATRAVAQARDRYARLLRVEREARAFLEDEEEALLVATLAGFPDRVAKLAKGRSYRFAAGRSGELDQASVVEGSELLVAVE
ncbi:MAG: ATP-dependent RNA helicase, partial [Deltaproteobacteria bacterium]|nr:ATP-dependent RNA helicase [Deltaproteobacteria bacterium]